MIGHIRRETKDFCNQHNCNTIKEDVAIVVTELASNALKHAKDGSIIIKEILGSKYTGIEIIYMDKGTGFDTEKVVQDGFSTAGSWVWDWVQYSGFRMNAIFIATLVKVLVLCAGYLKSQSKRALLTSILILKHLAIHIFVYR